MNGLASYLLPWHHVGLIRQFAGREVHARYRQSWLGAIWLVLTPLAMLGIYTLVFRHVMRVRWQDLDEGNLSFALRIYAGLAVFNFFAECVNRAPNLVRDQPHLVKKVVFPLEVMAWVNVASAMVGLLVSMALLLLLGFWDKGVVDVSGGFAVGVAAPDPLVPRVGMAAERHRYLCAGRRAAFRHGVECIDVLEPNIFSGRGVARGSSWLDVSKPARTGDDTNTRGGFVGRVAELVRAGA